MRREPPLIVLLLLAAPSLWSLEVHVTVSDEATWQDEVEAIVSGEYCGASGLGNPVVEGDVVTLEILDICSIISPAIPTPFSFTAELPRLFPGFYTLRVLAPQLPEGEVEIPLGIHETSELVVEVPPSVSAGQPFPITLLGRGCFHKGPDLPVSGGTVDIPVSLVCDFGGVPLGASVFVESFEIGPFPPGDYRVRVFGVADGDIPHLAAAEFTSHRADGCLPTETEICLHAGRFSVDVSWSTATEGGTGRAVQFPEADDSGFFWFFHPRNLEVMVKILDGCPINGHYWLFAAATTDVEYSIRVTDEPTGNTALFGNASGRLSPAFADPTLFPCGH